MTNERPPTRSGKAGEEEVDRAATATARRLDVMLFLNELDEEDPNPNRLRVDVGRLRSLWGIDASVAAEASTEPLTAEVLRQAREAMETAPPRLDYYQDTPAMRRALGIPQKEEREPKPVRVDGDWYSPTKNRDGHIVLVPVEKEER